MPVSKVLVATIMLITLNKQRPSNTFIWTVNFMMDLNLLSRRAARCARVSLVHHEAAVELFPVWDFLSIFLR